MTASQITIDPELQALIPPLSAEEYAQLEANIRAEGCLDALIYWQERGCILDGHNRYAICTQHGIPYEATGMSLPGLEAAKHWLLLHQLGRRNLTPDQMRYLRGKQYALEKHQEGRPEKLGQNGQVSGATRERLAAAHHVAPKTIQRDFTFAAAIDLVAAAAGPDARQVLLARETKVTQQDVQALAKIATATPQTAVQLVRMLRSAPSPQHARQMIRAARQQIPVGSTGETVPPGSTTETRLTPDGRTLYIVHTPGVRSVFTRTNEMVGWALWTWNPVTGCWHDCSYCYAREIANNAQRASIYPQQFEPTFFPHRLDAPANTPWPTEITRPEERHVFVGSMADLFGKWVPDDWIVPVFERVRDHPQWKFLFLTKFPQRLKAIGDLIGGFPDNAWVGCTVDAQARVATAERAFTSIKASVKWLSVEPLLEPLRFKKLGIFDWLVIGGQSESYFNGTPEFQPEWPWVESLGIQARAAGVKIYCKENLTVRPKETPW